MISHLDEMIISKLQVTIILVEDRSVKDWSKKFVNQRNKLYLFASIMFQSLLHLLCCYKKQLLAELT